MVQISMSFKDPRRKLGSPAWCWIDLPGGSLVTEEGLIISIGCVFEISDPPEGACSQRRAFHFNE